MKKVGKTVSCMWEKFNETLNITGGQMVELWVEWIDVLIENPMELEQMPLILDSNFAIEKNTR